MTTNNTTAPFVTLHALQAFGPSLLNRDDNNATKQIVYGGVPRVRVSAQSWRRAIRDKLRMNRIEGAEYVTRTNRMPQVVAAALVDLGRPADAALIKSIAMFGALGLKAGKQPATTAAMITVPESFAGTVAKLIDGAWDQIGDKAPATGDKAAPGTAAANSAGAGKTTAAKNGAKPKAPNVPDEVVKAAEAALDITKTIDGALFGRMLAEKTDGGRVDGAAAVAHTISVDPAAIEPDFWTAGDDEAPHDEPAASNMGVSMVSAPTFYRVASLDRRQLESLLDGDAQLATEAEDSFTESFIQSQPSAKQRSSVATTLPSLVVAVSGPQSLSAANAFVTPVTGPDTMVQSAERLLSLLARSAGALRKPSTITLLCTDPELLEVVASYGEVHGTVDSFINAVVGA